MAMLTLEEAQARLLALAPSPRIAQVPLTPACCGSFLAHDVLAMRTQPPADLSAMDGYATSGEGPWQLVGESRAGAPFAGALECGQCTRISTGAHLPGGADSVLIQENAAVDSGQVTASEAPLAGRHIRRKGFDFNEGDTVLKAGDRLTPARLALAIAAGHTGLALTDSPRIAVLDSGDELAPIGTQPGAHQIPASNGAMLAAMLKPHIGSVQALGPVGDRLDALAQALAKAEDCDILITSGGASVGDHDLIQRALMVWGARIDFWKVAIKPGKPLMVATRGQQVILGLPGNPVSAFVTAFLFALPLVRAAMGASAPLPRSHRLEAAHVLPSTGSRREFLRGLSDGSRAHLAASQDSSALLALAQANCLIDRPAGSPECPVGEVVNVYNLENG